jgi:hypothetical protein
MIMALHIGLGMAVIVHIAATSSPLQSSSSAHWSSLVRSHPLAANYAHGGGVVVVVVGLSDSWFDLRARLGRHEGGGAG